MPTPADNLPVYTAAHPPTPDSALLRASIPGWGADLDPRDRPSVPKLRHDLESGAHWDFPERQSESQPRERSIEHRFLTPVFGTAQPLGGLSGVIRRAAYRYSEGRAAHWLILLGADRVDVVEHRVSALFSRSPDNPIAEAGLRAELTRGGRQSRIGRKRTDVKHMWMDPVITTGPWLILGAIVTRLVRRRRG
ncbi:hypothetical protein FHR72_004552 [Mycolicibacterium iranicum]|uniref:Uncharacterized protein n=1 Tax=Mycolicibacterium iranicum TaxID=912594 RepID=A0A839QEX7_MYCIR|nr:hypothetical protein [Mycolicibacterium iranicum]MBB2993045.1 hypothetical protein [Mycolicibacterium iranicum]